MQYQTKNQTARERQYEELATTHGGYWRYDFIDHAYLYNLYFPPERFFGLLKSRVHELVLNYPVAQNVLARLVGELIAQPAERIVVGNGTAELIKIFSGNVAKKLIVPVPSFNEYANAAPAETVIEFPLDIPSFHLDVDRFAAAAKRCNADVAVVVTPNNPTSLSVSKADLIRLLKKLAQHDCMLIVDESFIDFTSNCEEMTLQGDIARHQNLAIFKSMSKAYGICGLRLGYLLTSNIAFAEKFRSQIPIWNVNGFAETFLTMAPQYRHEFELSCTEVRKDRDQFYLDLYSIEGLLVYKPEANYIFCRLGNDAPSGPEVTRQLFIEHNIYIKHCGGKTMPDSERYIRIASRTQEENKHLVEVLRSLLTPAYIMRSSDEYSYTK
jgi:histidinol-phosphate/aromatic aminotransferase/cobyric acid decarboxylase-like protein